MGRTEREQITQFYHDLVFARIEGKITQKELEKRLKASGFIHLQQRQIDHKSAAAGERIAGSDA